MQIRCVLWLLYFLGVSAADEPTSVQIGKAKPEKGLLLHEVRCEMQAKPTLIRVLLPSKLDKARRYLLVFVLPVEAGTQTRYGDGLLEVQKSDLHNKKQAIFVQPTFAHLPWYADHPTNQAIQQERYLIDVVLPFVAKTYPISRDSSSRHLLGFSKSGWGAFTLLLRHPDKFGKAVAWDAPFMMGAPGRYGSGPIFGTRENFEKYQLTGLTRKADKTALGNRLMILGQGNFQKQHEQFHADLNRLGLAHVYREGTKRKHHWSSGWLTEAVELILE